MTADLQIRGLDPLLVSLRRLGQRDAKKALRTATRKSGDVVKKRAKVIAPVKDGGYKKALKNKALKLRAGESAAQKVGPGKGGKHGVLIERGTVERFHKSGKSTGRMPALQVLEKAAEQTKAEQERVFRAEVQKVIDKANQ